jgi:type IV pilus assembly protein PilO
MNPNDPGLAARTENNRPVGLFALIIAAGWWFVWNDQFIDLETKEREEETLKQQFLDKKRQAVNLDLYVQQLGNRSLLRCLAQTTPGQIRDRGTPDRD